MLPVVHRAIDVELASEVCLRLIELTLLHCYLAQLAHGRSDARMHWPIDALLNAKCLVQHVSRLVESSLSIQRPAEDGHQRSRFGVVFAVEATDDVQRLTIVAFSFGVMAPLALDRAEVDQILGNIGMALAIELAIHGQSSLIQRFRDVQVSSVEVRVRQFAKAHREIGRYPARRGLNSHRFIEYRDGLAVGPPIRPVLGPGSRYAFPTPG